jgi:hypothetical protein
MTLFKWQIIATDERTKQRYIVNLYKDEAEARRVYGFMTEANGNASLIFSTPTFKLELKELNG